MEFGEIKHLGYGHDAVLLIYNLTELSAKRLTASPTFGRNPCDSLLPRTGRLAVRDEKDSLTYPDNIRMDKTSTKSLIMNALLIPV